jgi:flagellar basal body-associated protein FliL
MAYELRHDAEGDNLRKTILVIILITVLLIVIGTFFIYKTYVTVYDKVKEVDKPDTENVSVGPNQVVYFNFNLLKGQADIHIKRVGDISDLYDTDFYTSKAGSYKIENSGS